MLEFFTSFGLGTAFGACLLLLIALIAVRDKGDRFGFIVIGGLAAFIAAVALLAALPS